jgi:hypothetical protein
MIKAASSDETSKPVVVAEDARLKKARLVERADDLALRIRSLQQEEEALRQQASAVVFA